MTTELPEEPKSRKEQYLADIAGQDVELPAEPKSREEQYLAYIAENGGGGGGGGTSNFNQLTNRPKYNGQTMTGSTDIPEVKSYSAGTGLDLTGTEFSVDTTTIQPKLTAGSNITISEDTISATDTTYSNFVGTDGTAAGTAGLVPAPATTDAGKFLKADGTWDTAGGGAIELTTADYNYPTDNPTSVALWLLDPGVYYVKSRSVRVDASRTSTDISGSGIGTTYIVGEVPDSSGARRTIITIGPEDYEATYYFVQQNTGTQITSHKFLLRNSIKQATGTSTTSVMSQNATTDAINAISQSGSGAPTTSTAGTVGQLYQDTTNGKLYICTDAANPYVWEEVGDGGGGGSVTELTTADLDYPDNNPTGVALWRLAPGIYSISSNAFVGMANTSGELSSLIDQGVIVVAKYSSSSTSIVAFDILQGTSWMFRTTTDTGAKGTAVRISPNITQTTGTSTTDVMSQNAVTSMVYADPSTKTRIQIGDGANVSKLGPVAIGASATVHHNNSVAIGRSATAGADSTVALGAGSAPSTKGEVSIGDDLWQAEGYNNSRYRLLTGLYDGQNAHDAATKGQLDSIAIQNAGAPTTATVGTVGQLLEDTTNGKLYQCTDTTGGSYTWVEVGAGGGATYTAGDGIDITNAVISATNTGKAKELTTADYNYHSSGSADDGLAPWLLSPGLYYYNSNMVIYGDQTTKTTRPAGSLLIVRSEDNGRVTSLRFTGAGITIIDFNSNGSVATAESSVLRNTQVVDNLTSTSAYRPLSANQGKVLKDLVDEIATMGILTTSPTGTTAGVPGRLYTYDTGGGTYEVYLCVHDNGDNTYVWKQVSLI